MTRFLYTATIVASNPFASPNIRWVTFEFLAASDEEAMGIAVAKAEELKGRLDPVGGWNFLLPSVGRVDEAHIAEAYQEMMRRRENEG